MNYFTLLILILFGLFFNGFGFALASEINLYKKFAPEEYDQKDFLIDTHIPRQGDASIKIIQAKRIGKPDQSPYACRAWLEVTVSNQPAFSRYYDDIDPAGFSYGIVIPEVQPSEKWLMLVKNGDYDGRLFLIGRDGKTFDYPGGSYFLSPDQRFLFSDYETDGSELTVIDLNDGHAVFSIKDSNYAIDTYYSDGSDVFFSETEGAIYKYDQQKGIIKLDIDKKDIPDLREISYLFDPRKYADCANNQKDGSDNKSASDE